MHILIGFLNGTEVFVQYELGRKDACKVFKEMKMTSQEILKGEKK